MEGDRGPEPGSNGSGKSTGGRRREGWRRDIQGDESREKQKINFTTLCNFSQWKKHTEVGTTKEGGGNQAYKVREAGNSDPPAHNLYTSLNIQAHGSDCQLHMGNQRHYNVIHVTEFAR